MNTYIHSILKSVKYVLLVALGLFVAGFVGEFPEYANMTVGALMIAVYDVLKHRCGFNRLP